jgi:hypothetical protein
MKPSRSPISPHSSLTSTQQPVEDGHMTPTSSPKQGYRCPNVPPTSGRIDRPLAHIRPSLAPTRQPVKACHKTPTPSSSKVVGARTPPQTSGQMSCPAALPGGLPRGTDASPEQGRRSTSPVLAHAPRALAQRWALGLGMPRSSASAGRRWP